MIQITVALPNGHVELLTLLPSSTVQDVRTKAQLVFGKKHLRLVTAKNRVLVDFKQTLEEAEIEDGECLTALVPQPQVAATGRPLPCGVMWIAKSLPGVMQRAATVPQLEISSRVLCRLGPHICPLLRFWQMDLSW